MPAKIEMQRLHPRGRTQLCILLTKALPPLPSEIEAALGPTNVALIHSVMLALESASKDAVEGFEQLALGLTTIVAVAERRAGEIAAKEYTPGDNYGFSGAADTYGEIYHYLSAHVRTIAAAVACDVQGCVDAFRSALRFYAMYSANGDPKGAVHREIEEAEERSEKVLLAAYASIPQEWKEVPEEDLEPSSPGTLAAAPQDATAPSPQRRAAAQASPSAESALVFVSFKNLDASGVETRDSQLAREVALFLRKEGISVFLSLDSLEQLGTSAYKKAIDNALDDARILVAVGTSREHFESDWVRYEWDSFLHDMMSGVKPNGQVFSVVEGMEQRDLPRGLRLRQSFMSDQGELRNLANFIKHALA